MTADEFQTSVRATSEGVLAALKAEGPKTAWDLKIEMKASHTLLHLALGLLMAEGRVVLKPEGYTYLVEPAAPTVP